MKYKKQINSGLALKNLIAESGITPYKLAGMMEVSTQRIYSLQGADNATVQIIDEVLYYIGKTWGDFGRALKDVQKQAQGVSA